MEQEIDVPTTWKSIHTRKQIHIYYVLKKENNQIKRGGSLEGSPKHSSKVGLPGQDEEEMLKA